MLQRKTVIKGLLSWAAISLIHCFLWKLTSTETALSWVDSEHLPAALKADCIDARTGTVDSCILLLYVAQWPARTVTEALRWSLDRLLPVRRVIDFVYWQLDSQVDSFYSARNARIASAVIATAIPSVRLSVRPSHAGIVSKRRHVARCSLHHWIAKCV